MMEQEITKTRHPMEHLKTIFRRKWLFITPLFIGIVAGIVACFLIPPAYESSTVILVEEEKIINPLIQDIAVSTSAVQRMQTIREIILGWNSLVELTKKLNLAKNVGSQLEFEKLILDLRKNIFVKIYGQNLFRISYRGKTPQETQLVAQTLTDILVEENKKSQTKETDVAIDFIKEQLQVYKRKIKRSEIAKMEEELKALLIDSTQEHPIVKELQEKITSAKEELGTEAYQGAESEEPVTEATYETLRKELDKIIKQEASTEGGALAFASTDPNDKLYKLILMDKLDSVLARDLSVNEKIYNMLLQKLETAKITQRLEASKQGTRYTIIDPPRLPLTPVQPNKSVVILLGFVLGGVSGTGLVFGKEFMDQSFMDIEEAKEILELPVLGAISRLTTQEDIDKEKLRKIKLIGLTIFLAAASITAAAMYYFFKK